MAIIIATITIITIIITAIITIIIILLIIINIIRFGTDIETMSVVMEILGAACRLLLTWDIEKIVACLSGCYPHPLNVGCAHSPE